MNISLQRLLNEKEYSPDLSCPICLFRLNRVEGRLECGFCNRSFKIEGNTVYLMDGGGFVAGPLEKDSQQYLKDLALEVRRSGWEKGSALFYNSMAKEQYVKIVRLLEPRQSGWKFLMGCETPKRLLTIDTDFGGAALALAKSFSQVYMVFFNHDMLECVRSRIKLEGVDNICCVYTQSIEHLSFEDHFFDSIVFSGVNRILQEICRLMKLRPMRGLRWLVEEAFRVLRPGGEICITGENRFSYNRLSGLLKGNFFCGMQRETPLSLYRMESSLKRAGFLEKKTYFLLPALNSLKEVIDCRQDRANRSGNLKEALIRGKSLFRVFTPAFLIVGSKGRSKKNIVERLVDHWSQHVAKPRQYTAPVIKRYLFASPNVIILAVGNKNDNRSGVIFRIPLEQESLRRCWANMEILAEIQRDKRVMAVKAPEPLWTGEFEGQLYFVEREIQGRIINRLVPGIHSISLRAVEVLIQFHRETAVETRINGVIFNALVSEPLDVLAAFVEHEQNLFIMRKLKIFLRKTFLNKALPLVWFHGDFKIENMIVHPKSGDIEGIIDWDLSQRQGLPLLDLLHFTMFNQSLILNIDIGTLIREKLVPCRLEASEKSIIDRYLASLHISEEYLFPLVVMYWLHHVSFRLGDCMRRYNPLMEYHFFRILWAVHEKIENGYGDCWGADA